MSLNHIQAANSYISHLRMDIFNKENHLEVHTGKNTKNPIQTQHKSKYYFNFCIKRLKIKDYRWIDSI